MKKTILALAIASISVGANAGTVTSDGGDVIVATKGGFSVKTADKKNAFNIGGRIQWDYNNAEADSDSEPDENNLSVRRARIFLKGTVDKNWDYKAQFNIGESEAGDVEDLYIRYKGWGKAANLTVGRQKEPFGLEEQTSSKDISILERSALTEQHAFGRNTGVQLHGKGKNWTYGVGLFENETADDDRGAEDLALTGRFTYAPINDKGNVFHLGLAFSERSGTQGVSGNAAESAMAYEIAGVNGAFHYQGEYFDTDQVDGDSLDGYYVQAGWVFTGESRPYKDGKFKIIKPSTDAGAWEAVVRYEAGDGNFSDIELGRTDGSQLALGLNYYPNSAIRIGASLMTGEDDVTGEDGDEFRVRLQYVYK
ncbi:OprO/OprP family phosphate-selective porin [Porticoccus sp. GXU_MW_L64]